MTKCDHRTFHQSVYDDQENLIGERCTGCGEIVFKIDERQCGTCKHFRGIGTELNQHNICTKKLMRVTKTMHVMYSVLDGTCYEAPAP